MDFYNWILLVEILYTIMLIILFSSLTIIRILLI